MPKKQTLSGTIADVVSGRVYTGHIHIENGVIVSVVEARVDNNVFIMPGFVDAHVHIESSMLSPIEFARVALRHGTIAAVADPHEIANVLGSEGVEYMINNAKLTPFVFQFGVPSCVPATKYETSGAVIDAAGVELLLGTNDIGFLSEMMNFPGVLHQDAEVMAKITAAHKLKKPIDGHAPGLRGQALKTYAAAGITTDHECFTLAEAHDKINEGMMIQIREGSAARNFDELAPLIATHPEKIMFCSDDMHPDALLKGHINLLVKRALNLGYPLMNVLRACTLNPVRHYSLKSGLLQAGDPANFIIVSNFETPDIMEVWMNGRKMPLQENHRSGYIEPQTPNHFYVNTVTAKDFEIEATGSKAHVIGVMDGQIVSRELKLSVRILNRNVVTDIENDVLKIAVLNRYKEAKPALGLVNGFGIRSGALASSVAHDSHNIVVVGTNDADMAAAVNLINENRGGICFVNGEQKNILPLPIAGIISNQKAENVAEKYLGLDKSVKSLGCSLQAPFMSLSFMALLVIPALKMSDKGLFDVQNFSFKNLIFD